MEGSKETLVIGKKGQDTRAITSYTTVIGVAILCTVISDIVFIASITGRSWEITTFPKLAEEPELINRVVRLPNVTGMESTELLGLWVDGIMYLLYNTDGGLWEECDRLTSKQRDLLASVNQINKDECFDFVNDDSQDALKGIWLIRMHSTALSCIIVANILLTVSHLTMLLGIFRKCVPAFMITGTFFVVIATFTLFTLAIVHSKRNYKDSECLTLDAIPDEACPFRVNSLGWCVSLAWFCTFFCIATSTLWLYAARLLRIQIQMSQSL